MAGQKTSLTNSDLEILKDEPEQHLGPVIKLESGAGPQQDPGTAVRVINQSSEADFRATSLLKAHLDLSPIRAGEGDSPGLNDREMKLQDFVEMAEASKPLP